MNKRHLARGFAPLALLALPILPSHAAIPEADGTINACYNATTGALRVIDVAASSCRMGEASLQWNVRGNALAWAHVRPDGTLASSSGNLIAVRVGDGMYCFAVVGATVNVAVATIDSQPNLSGAVQTGVFPATICPEGVRDIFVVTRVNANAGGLPGLDRAFYLLVN